MGPRPTREEFEREMTKAKTFQAAGDAPGYWSGYMRGLRRRYHGNAFGTDDEHQQWVSLINDEDRQDLGRGYRDGLGVPHYCTQNNGDCSTCALGSYGRDCQNNPIE